MLKKVKSVLTDDEELDIEYQKILSLIFLLLAGAMSFISYSRQIDISIFHFKPNLKFTPGFLSAILGIVFISPLYIRKILKWNRSIYSILSFVLILLVISSFLELATGGNHKNNIVYSLVVVSIVLSWLGIKGVAGISWVIVLASAVCSVLLNNYILGFYGFLYVMFGFLGLILHTGMNPGAFFKELKSEYGRSAHSARRTIKKEISETGELASKLV